VLTVTLSPSEEPAVLAVTGCEHVSEDTAAVILPRLRSNGYVVRVDITDHRCPWCDGTGRYACTSHDRVPCGYCHATGQRTEPVERVAIGRGLWTEWGKEANPVTLGPLAA
jgi:hypothetical protein